MIYAFLFIIIAASTNVSSQEDEAFVLTESEVPKTCQAYTEYINHEHSWEPSRLMTIRDALAEHEITMCHLAEFIRRGNVEWLPKLQDLSGIEFGLDFTTGGVEELRDVFINALYILNVEWVNVPKEKRTFVLEYLLSFVGGDNEFYCALVYRIARSLPGDQTLEVEDSFFSELRYVLGGVNSMFLANANAEEPIVNKYLALLLAVLKLTNIRDNTYIVNYPDELTDDLAAWESVQTRFIENALDEELQFLTAAALDVFEITIVKAATDGYPPSYTAFNEFIQNEIENNYYGFIPWLTVIVKERVDCYPNGLYANLQTLL